MITNCYKESFLSIGVLSPKDFFLGLRFVPSLVTMIYVILIKTPANKDEIHLQIQVVQVQ